jgi:hypothetical protein
VLGSGTVDSGGAVDESVTLTLSSAGPHPVAGLSAVSNSSVVEEPAAVKVHVCVVHPMLPVLCPVTLKLKVWDWPAAETDMVFTIGTFNGLPARSNITSYCWPATVAKLWAIPPGQFGMTRLQVPALPSRSKLRLPSEAPHNDPM